MAELMDYSSWSDRRHSAIQAVAECCRCVADELGVDYEMEAIGCHLKVVAHPDPGGFGFRIRIGHLDTDDVIDVTQFYLPPGEGLWPLWLSYLAYVLRFHWSYAKIGDRAMYECLGRDLAMESV